MEMKCRAWNTDYAEPKMEYFDLLKSISDPDENRLYKFHDKEWMQCAGAMDVLSAFIYDGDICRDGDTYLQVYNDGYQWMCRVVKSSSFNLGMEYPLKFWKPKDGWPFLRLEVVGNVFETPELIEFTKEEVDI